ncbi:acyltransferase family protein [Nocardioides sp. MAHUQ-72]|uniref:acyltransferase family protein n=1 Tax=unclassified Nocardioides TaxID=2615069 RepID=UPI003613181B
MRPEPGQSNVGPLTHRIDFVDGIRAVAAMYVVVHHVWLTTHPDYLTEAGSPALQWLAYGYVAVAVFIVVSGFSLSISPARHGWRLGNGSTEFFRRRAWRILPTYYAAMVLSCLVFGLVTPAQTGDLISAKAVVVHALLVQDAIDSPDLNATFWSIAVECQIYLFFPFFLLFVRRWGVWRLVVLVSGSVIVAYLVAGKVSLLHPIINLTPQFGALFVMGMAAGRVLSHGPVRRPRVLVVTSAVLFAAFVTLCASLSIDRVERSYFWITFLVGGATACLIAALTLGRLTWLRRLLASRALSGVGLFSYTIYLVHLPVLWLLWHFVVEPSGLGVPGRFALLLALCVPAVIAFSYLFSLAFERPFLTHRTFRSSLDLVLRRGRTHPVPQEEVDAHPATRPADVAP